MVKNNMPSNNYTYGNTAVELIPEIKREEKREVKIKRKPKNKFGLKIKMICVIGIVCVFSFLTLLRFASIINLQGNIRTIKGDIVKIQKDNENLRVNIALQNNLKKIEEVAVNQYKMVEPQLNSIIYVDVKPLTLPEEKEKTTAFQFVQRFLGLIY
jgi:cell division protein FtsL